MNSSTNRSSAPALRLTSSVSWDKQSVLRPAIRTVPSRDRSYENALIKTSSYSVGLKHKTFQAVQRDKLLMGAEREVAQLKVMFTTILGLLALLTLNWRLAVLAVIFGGPVQWLLRMLSQEDPDYIKVYLEGLTAPQLRSPE